MPLNQSQPEFSEEERESLRLGEESLSLSEHPAWKRLLDTLEKEADGILAKMRACESADDRVHANLMREWRLQEKWFERLHEIVYIPIEDRKKLLRDIAEQSGREERQVETQWATEEQVYG